jgi:hypothetical protein
MALRTALLENHTTAVLLNGSGGRERDVGEKRTFTMSLRKCKEIRQK